MTTQNEAIRTDAEFKIASAEAIIRDIQVDNVPYVNVAIYLKTSGNTDNGYMEAVKASQNRISALGLRGRNTAFIQEEAFRQCSPFDSNYSHLTNISSRVMSMKALFAGLPFNGSGLIDREGYYIGTDEDGRMIAVSTFYKGNDRTNSNIVIEGASGSGKSFLAKKLMLNEWLNGTKIFIIDPESEYRPLCKLLEGKWIDCSGGKGESVGRINPLQVTPVDKQGDFDEEDEEYNVTKSALSLHLDFLSSFFKLYYPEMSSLSQSLLMEVLEELYKNFGIDYDTDIDGFKNEDFPIMEDLYKLLEQKADDETQKHQTEIEELRAIIRGLAIGNNAEIFNGSTTIKMDNDFVCLDVYSLQGASENVKRCQYFNILRYCQDEAFKDRTTKCYVVCDEAYLLIDKKVPQSIEFMRNFCKRARKYECGLMTITQSLVDFLAPEVKQYGQAILDNSTYKFFFGIDGQDLLEVTDLYNLNTEEKAILSQKEQGRGLFFVGTGHQVINVKPLEWELPYLVGGGR